MTAVGVIVKHSVKGHYYTAMLNQSIQTGQAKKVNNWNFPHTSTYKHIQAHTSTTFTFGNEKAKSHQVKRVTPSYPFCVCLEQYLQTYTLSQVGWCMCPLLEDFLFCYFLTNADQCRLERHTMSQKLDAGGNVPWRLFSDQCRRCKKKLTSADLCRPVLTSADVARRCLRTCVALHTMPHPPPLREIMEQNNPKQWPATKHWLQGQIMEGHTFDQGLGSGGRMMKKTWGKGLASVLLFPHQLVSPC